MRKLLLILLLMSVTFTFGYAQQKRKAANRRPVSTQKKVEKVQNCEVNGVVTYFYNKFFGNRPDVGATVKLIKVEDLDSTKFNHTAYSYYIWNRSAAAAYWEFYNKYGQSEADRSIGSIYDFQKANWDNYDAICDTLGAVQIELAMIFNETDKKYNYEAVVDGTGAFKLIVPYGEYYAYIKSENRKGIFMPEMVARFELKKIKLDKPTYILKENFDKE
ncbi:MAG: hypothetical protein IJ618_01130 [Prevotella sp.]|nr:hypothetical protein [Prevotella sp.]